MGYGERYNLEKLSGRGISVIECGFLTCDRGHTIGVDGDMPEIAPFYTSQIPKVAKTGTSPAVPTG